MNVIRNGLLVLSLISSSCTAASRPLRFVGSSPVHDASAPGYKLVKIINNTGCNIVLCDQLTKGIVRIPASSDDKNIVVVHSVSSKFEDHFNLDGLCYTGMQFGHEYMVSINCLTNQSEADEKMWEEATADAKEDARRPRLGWSPGRGACLGWCLEEDYVKYEALLKSMPYAYLPGWSPEPSQVKVK